MDFLKTPTDSSYQPFLQKNEGNFCLSLRFAIKPPLHIVKKGPKHAYLIFEWFQS